MRGFTTISNSHGLETVVLAPSLAGTAASASGGWGNLCERAAGARLQCPGEGFGNLWCRARSGSTGSTGFPALGFAARIRKICKIKRCGCEGYHRSLFLF